ncbi:putative methyltransferase NSUN7 isoform X1 [Pygocentrus nattereri]|uniref:SAM-dependent MTase RsmB/NOP-type domain-containing protein n=2 Tax=Pygocentrus nattereri TaxID=42514 RepID=A0A3B4EDT3_PYGNA|nr:putative methyltransferase NSUN7 isoform X1 [Pygocentrus nattereri]XP_037400617.1 putative methyltransferase NSUN7 isoform X1 [Pygocentrus nattereri]
MVKHGARHSSSSHSSKHASHISSFKELSLLERDREPPSPPVLRPDLPSVQPQSEPSDLGDGPSRLPDHVYLHAAAIFQNTHQEKAVAHRLISYGKSGVTVPEVKDEVLQRLAYKLAFNTLKYQELLEDIMIDSCFYVSQPVPEYLMSLVAVMLYDFQDRKFLPRERLANQTEQEIEPAVQEVEKCLLRFKTKLAASLARCRIKHDLLTIDCILPESIRQRQERASNLPLYAWVNMLRTSMDEVCDLLRSVGFSHVNSVGQLDGQTFCQDVHCLDLLVFPASVRGELYKTSLLSDHRLIIQDKSCCVGPWALRPLLDQDGDVLMAGSFSASTIAHTSAIIAAATANMHTHTFSNSLKKTHGTAQVLVCTGERSCAEKEELQEVLSSMGCNNVKLLPEAFHAVDVSDSRLQKVLLVSLTPQCSLSAVSNPVDYLLQENGDTELLQDLSQGSISQSRLNTLISQQKRDLQHALHFPKVQAVVYSTCSSLLEENEEVVKKALSLREQDGSRLQPFRLSCPSLLQNIVSEEDKGKGEKASFFRLEASNQSNGCFLAVLARQPEPEVTETPQEVLARAAATGLLDGIQPSQPTRKEGRGRQTRKGTTSQGRPARTRSRTSLSSQSRLEEFLNHETKASSSALTLALERTNGVCSPRGKAKPKSINFNLGSASCPVLMSSSTLTSSPAMMSSSTLTSCSTLTLSSTLVSSSTLTSSPALSSSSNLTSSSILNSSSSCKSLARAYVSAASTNTRRAPAPVVPPPGPPKGRQEVLHPAALMFPPVLFPGLSPPSVQKSKRTPHLRLNPTLSYLQWKNPPAAAPLPHTYSSSIRHPRPWL